MKAKCEITGSGEATRQVNPRLIADILLLALTSTIRAPTRHRLSALLSAVQYLVSLLSVQHKGADAASQWTIQQSF